MRRVCEPELMEGAAQARAYADADFSESEQLFLSAFARHAKKGQTGLVADIGSGPGAIARAICANWPEIHVIGYEGSAEMLRICREKVRALPPDVGQRMTFVEAKIPFLATCRTFHACDVVMSNSVLHHLHRPAAFWRSIRDLAREGGRVVCMDLRRPSTRREAEAIVNQYASSEPELLRIDYYRSLLASFTVEEVRLQLRRARLPLVVEEVSDRHLLVSGTL